MSWTLLVAVTAVLAVAFVVVLSRRLELARMGRTVRERDDAIEHGAAEAQLQFPVVDLSRCLGCGTCVSVCPEDGVLDLVHGQAVVVNGAQCQGISACERECPVDAITVTLANVETRDDIPVVETSLEAVGVPGLFLAGEVTAHALIKVAVEHGTSVAAEVAARCARTVHADSAESVLDLCVIGAGPGGLACSLEAKRHGLRFVTLDQADGPGGTVAKYPRRKLVMTEPVDLPLHGRLKERTYTKEELMELWHGIAAEHDLPLQTGETFTRLDRDPSDGHFVVHTEAGTVVRARHVCLAVGRRGTPRVLGVPGEELPKVAYSLIDANAYAGRRVLVVGGGDSAVEAALALAEQPETQVTMSYRGGQFVRVRSKNLTKLQPHLDSGRVRVLWDSEVEAIEAEAVQLRRKEGGATKKGKLSNDDVFVMIGGIPPFELLREAGVSFDPSLRPPPEKIEERGTGVLPALGAGLALAIGALVWTLWHYDYYGLPTYERPAHEKHSLLRPGLGMGLAFGIAAAVLILVNLVYLARRSPRMKLNWGSLSGWMTSHVATGILAMLCALLHAAMAPRDTVGGQAFWALVVLLVTGAIGRYFYAWVPRAANGRELDLVEVKGQMRAAVDGWDPAHRAFAERSRDLVNAAVEREQWKGSFVGRIFALIGIPFGLRRLVREIQRDGLESGVPDVAVRETVALARRAHQIAITVRHYEDLRALLGSWRFLHRWVALFMVLLVIAHVIYALSYGAMMFQGGGS